MIPQYTPINYYYFNVLLFIWQDVRCYTIKIISQSNYMITISDILLWGSISIIFFSGEKKLSDVNVWIFLGLPEN